MKKLKCYDCENVMEAESKEDMLNQFYAHYMEEHKEIITGADGGEKKRWMEKFSKDWESA